MRSISVTPRGMAVLGGGMLIVLVVLGAFMFHALSKVNPVMYNACTYNAHIGPVACGQTPIPPYAQEDTFAPEDLGIHVLPDGSGVGPGVNYPAGTFVVRHA